MEPLFLGLRHVALNVRDVEKSIHFYSTILGMEGEWRPDSDNAYLTSGQDNLALHKLPAGAQPGKVQTVHHIGFAVKHPENVDEWAERLRKNAISWPRSRKRIEMGRDPSIFTTRTVS